MNDIWIETNVVANLYELDLAFEDETTYVALPGSVDEPWNGLALCANHHYAFDGHLVGVNPDSRGVVFQRVVHEQTETNPATRSLVDSTFAILAEPVLATARPKQEMFDKRYEYFAGQYEWVMP